MAGVRALLRHPLAFARYYFSYDYAMSTSYGGYSGPDRLAGAKGPPRWDDETAVCGL